YVKYHYKCSLMIPMLNYCQNKEFCWRFMANRTPLFPTRALVDMLRHQSSPVQQDERNNSVALTVTDGQGTLGRAPKNLYAPGVPSKDNRCKGFLWN
ncbi:hypothetical protein XENOCAPTIV_027945, partial [Xenoophorus captivus]